MIDGNAYIGHWPFRRRKYGTCEALLGRMNEFGVELSVISALEGVFYKNPQTTNRELYEQLQAQRKFRERLIPFAVINPIYGGWKDDIEVCTTRFRMKGIRLYPKYHGYRIDHPHCIETVKIARDKGLPVAFSLRMVDSRPSSWLDIREEWALKDVLPIIRAVPDAKYLILNLAGSLKLSGEETELLRGADLVMDTSGRSLTELGRLIKVFGPDKFVFGTHSPILDYCTGLLRIESLHPEEAGEEVKEGLYSENISRFCNLKT